MKKVLISLVIVLELLGLQADQPKSKTMKSVVVEMVHFKFQDQVLQAEAEEALKQLSTFAKAQAGFIKRTVLRNADGSYTDLVWWESLEEAQAAAKKAETSPDCAPLFGLMDFNSISMNHSELLWEH